MKQIYKLHCSFIGQFSAIYTHTWHTHSQLYCLLLIFHLYPISVSVYSSFILSNTVKSSQASPRGCHLWPSLFLMFFHTQLATMHYYYYHIQLNLISSHPTPHHYSTNTSTSTMSRKLGDLTWVTATIYIVSCSIEASFSPRMFQSWKTIELSLVALFSFHEHRFLIFSLYFSIHSPWSNTSVPSLFLISCSLFFCSLLTVLGITVHHHFTHQVYCPFSQYLTN